MVAAEVGEQAKSADRHKVAEALRTVTFSKGPAVDAFPGGQIKFDGNGRRVGAPLVIVQWQNGVPVTVYPEAAAFAKPVWPKQG